MYVDSNNCVLGWPLDLSENHETTTELEYGVLASTYSTSLMYQDGT